MFFFDKPLSKVSDKELLTKLIIRHWMFCLSTVTIYTTIVRKCIFVYDITITVYMSTLTIFHYFIFVNFEFRTVYGSVLFEK